MNVYWVGSRNKTKDEEDEDEIPGRKVEFADEDAIVSLSAESCATIVDCVIGELDDTLLTPPTAKKMKVLQDPPHAILN